MSDYEGFDESQDRKFGYDSGELGDVRDDGDRHDAIEPVSGPPDIDDDFEEVPEAPIIEVATPAKILSYLPDDPRCVNVVWPGQHSHDDNRWDARRKDVNHPIGQWSMATTPANPAVLYDDGAAFCSPTLAFDEAGSAIHCHSSPIFSGNFQDLEKYYFPELAGRLTDGRVTFVVGGTNIDVTEVGKAADRVNPIDWAVNGIEERLRELFPDADFHALVSKQYANQVATHPSIPEKTAVRGFIFVPKYIAVDGLNHVLAATGYDTEYLRRVFDWTKLHA
jgi:hypothetical protein